MQREDIFKLLEKNYNIKSELKKICDLLEYDPLFIIGKRKACPVRNGFPIEYLNFEQLIQEYLFDHYELKGTCTNLAEFYTNCNGELNFIQPEQITQEQVVNFLEVTENLLKLYVDNEKMLYRNFKIKSNEVYFKKLRLLLDTLEEHLQISIKHYSDRVVLYVGNYKLNNSLAKIDDPNWALELIKYHKDNLDFIEKRKILKQLDILVEPIIDSTKRKYRGNKNAIYNMADDLSFILNNFEIRHSNLNSESKDFKEKLTSFKPTDFNKIYDYAYELILNLLILSSYDNDSKIIIDYKSKIV